MIEQIQWLGHSSFVIQSSPVIYINPWRVSRTNLPADVILISHHHYHACSLADINKLRHPHTKVIGSPLVAQEIPDCTILRPWQSLTIDRTSIKAIPAYSPEDSRHPVSDGGLGFVISLNFYDIYYAGDTQTIPEMDGIRPDIAILPIDGNGTMTSLEAAQVVRKMRPQWAIPCNWGAEFSGATRVEAQIFAREVGKESEVVFLQPLV